MRHKCRAAASKPPVHRPASSQSIGEEITAALFSSPAAGNGKNVSKLSWSIPHFVDTLVRFRLHLSQPQSRRSLYQSSTAGDLERSRSRSFANYGPRRGCQFSASHILERGRSRHFANQSPKITSFSASYRNAISLSAVAADLSNSLSVISGLTASRLH